jgi:chemotaxis protein MotB
MKNQPVVIIKKGGHGKHGHHGGAWKVAYADFVTAMMAFFLVMWIIGQSAQVKAAVAAYFRDPGAFEQGRAVGLLPGASAGVSTSQVAPPQDVDAAKATLERVAAQLREAIQSIPKFAALGDRLQIHVTEEGLLIELLETNNESFFDTGSAHLREDTVALLQVIGKELSALSNKVAIEGHTDSRPYSAPHGYGNWELSVDRANAARRVMQPALKPTQMEAVRGYADQHLRYPDNPLDPRNRRISIVVRR